MIPQSHQIKIVTDTTTTTTTNINITTKMVVYNDTAHGGNGNSADADVYFIKTYGQSGNPTGALLAKYFYATLVFCKFIFIKKIYYLIFFRNPKKKKIINYN